MVAIQTRANVKLRLQNREQIRARLQYCRNLAVLRKELEQQLQRNDGTGASIAALSNGHGTGNDNDSTSENGNRNGNGIARRLRQRGNTWAPSNSSKVNVTSASSRNSSPTPVTDKNYLERLDKAADKLSGRHSPTAADINELQAKNDNTIKAIKFLAKGTADQNNAKASPWSASNVSCLSLLTLPCCVAACDVNKEQSVQTVPLLCNVKMTTQA